MHHLSTPTTCTSQYDYTHLQLTGVISWAHSPQKTQSYKPTNSHITQVQYGRRLWANISLNAQHYYYITIHRDPHKQYTAIIHTHLDTQCSESTTHCTHQQGTRHTHEPHTTHLHTVLLAKLLEHFHNEDFHEMPEVHQFHCGHACHFTPQCLQLAQSRNCVKQEANYCRVVPTPLLEGQAMEYNMCTSGKYGCLHICSRTLVQFLLFKQY